MGFKTTAALAVLFVALLGYLYFFEMRREKEEQRAREKARRAVQLDRGRVTRLTLQHNGLRVVGEKVGQAWQILEPVRAPGDWPAFEGLLRAAENLRVGVVADSAAASGGGVSFADYGLERPDVQVIIAQSDAPPDTIAFGDRNPVGQYVYVRKSGRPEILWTAAWQKKQFQRSLFELRDRRMMPFDLDRVRRLKIAYDGHVLVASRQGAGWRLEQPVADRGDDAAIAAFLNELKTGTAERFVAEQADDLAPYGLDRPWLTLSVYEGEDLAEKAVIFGGGTGRLKDEFYAKFLPRPQIFTVDSLFVLGLKKTAADVRNKEIYGFDRAGVDRIQAVYPGLRVECKRAPGRSGWTVVYPEGHRVLERQVEAVIKGINDLKAIRFAADRMDAPERYGLDRPAVRITLLRGGEVLREISVGRMGGRVFAKADHRPEVAEVNPEFVESLKLRLYLAEPK